MNTRNSLEPPRTSVRARALAVGGMLLLALVLRLWGAFHDVDFSYHGDELHFIKRSMAMGTGDLNPHWFHKPALLMYALLFLYGLYYLGGRLFGTFESVDAFGAHFLAEPGPFVVMGRLLVVAFGVATVYVVYRIALRAFRTFPAALATGLLAAVLLPMVVGSQAVKADVPAGFFVALSFLFFLRWRSDSRLRDLVLASVVAGFAMGTKYYGVLLPPAYGLVILADGFRRRVSWPTVFGQGTAVALLFVAAFFLVSPYNFLDPTWLDTTLGRAQQKAGLTETKLLYDPDNEIHYAPGLATTARAVFHLAAKVAGGNGMGLPLSVLLVIGVVTGLREKALRAVTGTAVLAILFFVLLASTWAAFHTNPRHLNAILPLMCPLVFAGALGAGRLFRPGPRAGAAAYGLLALAAIPTARATALHDMARAGRLDSRTVAYEWILENVPRDARILVDEYGPILLPSPVAVARLRARLEELPQDEAFTRHQRIRLDLLERFPHADARNMDELAHPWWRDREVPDDELRSSWTDRDMGNPLKSRLPKTLEAYRAAGVRYVVTNSRAQERYRTSPDAVERFPSFVRFYEELDALEPVVTFDPAEWNGAGPVVTVYLLGASPPDRRR